MRSPVCLHFAEGIVAYASVVWCRMVYAYDLMLEDVRPGLLGRFER